MTFASSMKVGRSDVKRSSFVGECSLGRTTNEACAAELGKAIIMQWQSKVLSRMNDPSLTTHILYKEEGTS